MEVIAGFEKPPFRDIWENDENIFKDLKVYNEQPDDKLKWVNGIVDKYLTIDKNIYFNNKKGWKMKYNHLRKPIDHFFTEIMIGKIAKELITDDMKLGDVIVALLKNAESKWKSGKPYCKENDCL